MKKVIIAMTSLVLLILLGCTKKEENNWIDMGEGPEDLSAIPYRTINLEGVNQKPDLPRTNPDLVSLTMGLQSGKLRGSWVYIQLFDCYAPQLRDGLPSILCKSLNNSEVFIVGNDKIREFLLSIEQKGKIAAIKGRAIGLYADIPVVLIKDETAQQGNMGK
ncbi:hypothetical protein ACO0LB_06850 [Undibacterium sp. SXout7W]|uniref:hypothetical protein n=1 Tax=Undibacterium sp. SXout7W TaxID=3413049 RepID=UPI003BF09065